MLVTPLMMKMMIYVPDKYYEQMLDNTLMHIYNQSCGFTMSICMMCENTVGCGSRVMSMNGNTRMHMCGFTGRNGYESFFFVMCASCRTAAQKNTGRIPSRGKQRNMMESIIVSRLESDKADVDAVMNPSSYSNIYVISVENGVEIILILGKKTA